MPKVTQFELERDQKSLLLLFLDIASQEKKKLKKLTSMNLLGFREIVFNRKPPNNSNLSNVDFFCRERKAGSRQG